MTHTVRIPWRWRPGDTVSQFWDTVSQWEEVCVWALEQFGLPGDRYTTHPVEYYMDFVFRDSRDAIYFKLRWS